MSLFESNVRLSLLEHALSMRMHVFLVISI